MANNSEAQLMLLDPTEYFAGMVDGAVDELKVEASDHAKFYLVRLLNHFLYSENLFEKNNEGRISEKQPLALLLGEAIESQDPAVKGRKLQELGDFSLYVAGFFSESLTRKLVDIDYYIGMGSRAYIELSHLAIRQSNPDLYEELGIKFSAFVDVLGQVSDETKAQTSNPGSILRIYDLWQRTGSKRLEKKLIELGINLEDTEKKSTN